MKRYFFVTLFVLLSILLNGWLSIGIDAPKANNNSSSLLVTNHIAATSESDGIVYISQPTISSLQKCMTETTENTSPIYSERTNLIPTSESRIAPNGDFFSQGHDHLPLDTTKNAGTITRVSITTDGTEGNGPSRVPSISNDGLLVAFESTANNLVNDDSNNQRDIFAHNRQTGQTTRVSVSSQGAQANDLSSDPTISADGGYIAFESDASNLVSDDNNNSTDIFVRDLHTGQTERVSISSSGVEGNLSSFNPTISSNGQFVAFLSYATNLVNDDTNDCSYPRYHNCLDVFVHDRQTRETSRISVASNGTQANNDSFEAAISGDGRYVTFSSWATNLESGVSFTFTTMRTYQHDRFTSQTSLISVATDGTPAPGSAASTSADGRYTVFSSSGSNLVIGDTNNELDVFVQDKQAETIVRASIASDGSEANGSSRGPVISSDGRFVSFYSDANNLIDGDNNEACDVFVHDLVTGQTSRVSTINDGLCEHLVFNLSISNEGRYVAFDSSVGNLVDADTNGTYDIFVFDLDLALAEQFAPYLYMNEDDPYDPNPIDAMLNYARLREHKPWWPDETVVNRPVAISDLGGLNENHYLDLWYYIDELSAYWNFLAHRLVYTNLVKETVTPTTYVHVARDEEHGYTIIQYWFFYYYNNHYNKHEGDWEMIQILLEGTGLNPTPKFAAYSQHTTDFGQTGGTKREWQYVHQATDSRPIVYVGKGSHASYFAEVGLTYPWFDTSRSGRTVDLSVHLELLQPDLDLPSWLDYPGRWGEYAGIVGFNGGQGPTFQDPDKLGAPYDWFQSLDWDEQSDVYHLTSARVSIDMCEGYVIYAIDNLRRWIGPDINEIDPMGRLAEYIWNCNHNDSSDRQTVLVHDPDVFAIIGFKVPSETTTHNTFKANAQQSQTITLTLNYPDYANDLVTEAMYADVTVGISSTGFISVASGDLSLHLDLDGDGNTDQWVQPAVTETEQDFTPPAAITDLSATVTDEGAVVLTWAATGDDDDTGTAIYYDIRYSSVPLIATTWVTATPIISPPVPALAGTTEVFTTTQIPGGQYYIAVKAVDDVLWHSELSNVAEADIPYRLVFLPLILHND
jgi:hypothetical protein